jgi:hypothetical protein
MNPPMMRFPLRSLFAMCSTLLCVSAADTTTLNQRWAETAFAPPLQEAASDQLILLKQDGPGVTEMPGSVILEYKNINP